MVKTYANKEKLLEKVSTLFRLNLSPIEQLEIWNRFADSNQAVPKIYHNNAVDVLKAFGESHNAFLKSKQNNELVKSQDKYFHMGAENPFDVTSFNDLLDDKSPIKHHINEIVEWILDDEFLKRDYNYLLIGTESCFVDILDGKMDVYRAIHNPDLHLGSLEDDFPYEPVLGDYKVFDDFAMEWNTWIDDVIATLIDNQLIEPTENPEKYRII